MQVGAKIEEQNARNNVGRKRHMFKKGQIAHVKKHMRYPNPFNPQEERAKSSGRVTEVSIESETEDVEIPEVETRNKVKTGTIEERAVQLKGKLNKAFKEE